MEVYRRLLLERKAVEDWANNQGLELSDSEVGFLVK